MQQALQQKQKLITILGIAAIALLILFLFVVPFFQHRGKVGIKVVVLPKDSTLYVDNKKVGQGKIYFEPGKHTLKATRADFADVTKSIDTKTIDKKETIYMMPKPNSDAAFAYLEAHPEEQEKREAAASAEVQKQQAQINKIPVLQELPYTSAGFEFTIDYDTETQNDDTQKIIYTITATTEEQRESARQWLKDHGVDIKKATIYYAAPAVQDDPFVGHQ